MVHLIANYEFHSSLKLSLKAYPGTRETSLGATIFKKIKNEHNKDGHGCKDGHSTKARQMLIGSLLLHFIFSLTLHSCHVEHAGPENQNGEVSLSKKGSTKLRFMLRILND